MKFDRTPEQHRLSVEAWRETAPANDWEILNASYDATWQGGSPRHSKLAEQLAPLIKWMSRPEGLLPEEDQPEVFAPIKTNWNIAPDNDNQKPEGFKFERGREIIPSVEMIKREMAAATYRAVPRQAVLKGGDAWERGHRPGETGAPVSGDIKRNRFGQLEQIGNLRFSNGNEHEYDTAIESAYKTGPNGGAVMTDVRTPLGGIVGQSEKPSRIEGAEDNPSEITASNAYFAEMLGTGRHRYIPGSNKKKRGKSYTATESRAMLAEAVANTLMMPTARKCPTALPCGSERVGDSFLGMKKATCAGGGSQGWEDICTALVNREVWAETVDAMKQKDIDVLQKAGAASNMEDIGIAIGKRGKNAERKGKAALLSANDNLKINLGLAA